MNLPKSVREIAEVIGTEKTLYLISQLPRCYTQDRRYPGAKAEHVILYVPTVERLKPSHSLVRILGIVTATKLCRAFGGEILTPANCSGIYREFRDKAIARMIREGNPVAMLADWFGVSDRHIKNIAREIPQEEIVPTANNNARC